jgi:hypothetical protein
MASVARRPHLGLDPDWVLSRSEQLEHDLNWIILHGSLKGLWLRMRIALPQQLEQKRQDIDDYRFFVNYDLT